MLLHCQKEQMLLTVNITPNRIPQNRCLEIFFRIPARMVTLISFEWALSSYKLYFYATTKFFYKTTEYNEISILKNVLKLHYIAFHEIYTILQTFYLFFYDMHNIQCIVTHTLTLTVIIRVHKYLARKNHAYIKNLSTKSSHLFTIMSYCIYINSY